MPADTLLLQGYGHDPDTRTNIPHDDLLTNDYVGIEVELENVIGNAQAESFGFWSVVGDGSLRNNGMEFIFNQPLRGTDVVSSLEGLQERMSQAPMEIGTGFRTSVHVHIDVRDMTLANVRNMLVAYMVHEDFLYELCGEGRKKNIYCPAISDAGNLLQRTYQFLRASSRNSAMAYINAWQKYSGINLHSIIDRGSIEFRGHRGTYNKDEILYWTNALLALKKFAMSTDRSAQDWTRSFINDQGSLDYSNAVYGDSKLTDYHKRLAGEMSQQGKELALDAMFLATQPESASYDTSPQLRGGISSSMQSIAERALRQATPRPVGATRNPHRPGTSSFRLWDERQAQQQAVHRHTQEIRYTAPTWVDELRDSGETE